MSVFIVLSSELGSTNLEESVFFHLTTFLDTESPKCNGFHFQRKLIEKLDSNQ
jgi:hypothetical protein